MTTIARASHTRPFDLEVDGITLSGLLAEPDGPPRGIVLALHGHGATARYFSAPADPQASLLELGAALGYTVWAPDRPGYGASTGVDPASFAMFRQAELFGHALAGFAAEHAIGAGCVLLGHSFGLKLALAMAGNGVPPPDVPLRGIEGAGTGLHYTFEPGVSSPPKEPGDAGAPWGPRHLYPSAIFDPELMPMAPMPGAPPNEANEWPADFRAIAARIQVPVSFTFGAHERLWRVDEEHFEELVAALGASPRVEVHVQPGAGHNVSLSHAARAYHLRALAFADDCLLDV